MRERFAIFGLPREHLSESSSPGSVCCISFEPLHPTGCYAPCRSPEKRRPFTRSPALVDFKCVHGFRRIMWATPLFDVCRLPHSSNGVPRRRCRRREPLSYLADRRGTPSREFRFCTPIPGSTGGLSLTWRHCYAPGPLQVSINRVTAKHSTTAAQEIERHYPRFSEWVAWWFDAGDVDIRTPQQLERDKYVLWAPWTGAYQRWMIIIPSCIIQLCLGSVSRRRVCSSYPLPGLSPPFVPTASSTRGRSLIRRGTKCGAALARTRKPLR